jgi:CubicO group peptidase (beta-lactamase class C family)
VAPADAVGCGEGEATRRVGVAEIDAAVVEAIAAGATPGAALVVGCGPRVVLERYYGSLAIGEPAVTAETLYDLSSLTKPLATLACTLQLVAERRIGLEARVCDLLPAFRATDTDSRRADVTWLQLAAHCSGLPARGLYFQGFAVAPASDAMALLDDRAACARRIVSMACAEPLRATPGHEVIYSDVGYIVLGALLERVTGQSLDELFGSRVARPLGPLDIGFRSLTREARWGRDDALERVAPTNRCDWRGKVLRGEVQDENAYAMGGVAGHAGLFGTARAVHAIVAQFVEAYRGRSSILPGDGVLRCWAGPGSVVPGSTWSLGWDTPSPGVSSAGRRISRRAFGHLGYTGTSIWVDLERGVHVVLLTNRVHPDTRNDGIRTMRPAVHDAVFEACDDLGWRE